MDEEVYIRKLGKNIKNIRKSKKMTHMDVSYITNIEKPNLARLESGRTNPTTKTLKRVADALGVQVSDFFSFEREG